MQDHLLLRSLIASRRLASWILGRGGYFSQGYRNCTLMRFFTQTGSLILLDLLTLSKLRQTTPACSSMGGTLPQSPIIFVCHQT